MVDYLLNHLSYHRHPGPSLFPSACASNAGPFSSLSVKGSSSAKDKSLFFTLFSAAGLEGRKIGGKTPGNPGLWKGGMETSLPKSSIYIVIDDLLRIDVRPPTLKAFWIQEVWKWLKKSTTFLTRYDWKILESFATSTGSHVESIFARHIACQPWRARKETCYRAHPSEEPEKLYVDTGIQLGKL